MEELIALSRAVAVDLATQFRGDPRGELTAWLHIALEREGLVASFYQKPSIESHLEYFPKSLARSAIAKLNGICASEERHVTVIRTLLAADSPWLQLAFEEGWGRLQGFVLGQLASTNAFAQAIALLLLDLGARTARERTAGRALAGLDIAGFLKFSRTLEITAVESYQRVAELLATLRRRRRGSLYGLALHLKILGILRDERVHRDVLHVLCGAVGSEGARARRIGHSEATELPHSLMTRRISSPADLNAVCHAILRFHYGAALPADASPQLALRTATDFWRWQMENPLRKSYLVECQRQSVFQPEGDILLLGTAGLEHVVRGGSSIRCRRLHQRLIPRALVTSRLAPHRPPR